MFSTGQLYFALFFLISFVMIMLWSYQKDIRKNRQYFKGSYKILLVFALLLITLFVIKFVTQG